MNRATRRKAANAPDKQAAVEESPLPQAAARAGASLQALAAKYKNRLESTDKPGSESTCVSFGRYTAQVGAHTSLLLFAALFLPRIELPEYGGEPLLHGQRGARWAWLETILPPPPVQTSLDKPTHPFVLPLVLNPTWTLLWMCLGAAALQLWWAGFMKNWWTEYTNSEDDEYDKAMAKTAHDKVAWSATIAALKTTFVFSGIIHIIVVLFGAPFFSHAVNTYLFSLLVSLLTVLVPAYVLGSPIALPSLASLVSSEQPQKAQQNELRKEETRRMVIRFGWQRLFVEFEPRTAIERALALPSFGAVIGAWLASIALALDWDRSWQAYPLPPAYGAVIGYVVASVGAVVFVDTTSE
ncbi:GPI biosynthesis protein family Pig-F-domain-containing protein [Schizophyllum fasciatum]